MNSLLTNWTPPKFEVLQSFMFKIHFQKAMSLNTGWIPTNKDQHFLETKNYDILLIDVINFKLQLINFVYLF